jgi:tetratricopeptide (TPR) repeat protein
MIGPVAAKGALDAGREVGRTLGNVYAWGVVGSIIGTFATGFVLINWLGTTAVIMAVACVLAAMAVFFQARSIGGWAWLAIIVLTATLATGSTQTTRSLGERLHLRTPLAENVIYFKQSQYSNVQVVESEENPMKREMHIDSLLHSTIDLDRPLDLIYSYQKVYAAITKRMFPGRPGVDSLMIGGGGYVYPQYMDAVYPASRTDVVEIDPEVTRAAKAAFGLPEDTAIRSFHEDARVFVDRLQHAAARGEEIARYDIIYVDAFNNYNVPFQLTTLEFTQNVREIIRPDGAYLIHLIDKFESALFLGALVNTVSEVFPYVYIFAEGIPVLEAASLRSTFVVAGFNHSLDTTDLDSECEFACKIFPFSESEFTKVTETPRRPVLTDDYAPIENLIASSARSYARERAYGDWAHAIEEASEDGGGEAALILAQEAMANFPEKVRLRAHTVNLLVDRGLQELERGAAEEAIPYLRRGLDIDSDHIRGRFALIDTYRKLEMIEQSIPLYTGLLDEDPTVRYNFATALAELGRYAEAAEQFQVVTQDMPNLAAGYNNYGNVLRLMGNLKGAVDQFRQALELESGFSDAQNNLTLVLALLQEGASEQSSPAAQSSR